MAAKKSKKPASPPNKRGRDADSGQFIPIEEAKRKPKTSVIETIPKPKKKKK